MIENPDVVPRCNTCGVTYVETYQGPCQEPLTSSRVCPGEVSWRASAVEFARQINEHLAADETDDSAGHAPSDYWAGLERGLDAARRAIADGRPISQIEDYL